jgi:hypothetical protein
MWICECGRYRQFRSSVCDGVRRVCTGACLAWRAACGGASCASAHFLKRAQGREGGRVVCRVFEPARMASLKSRIYEADRVPRGGREKKRKEVKVSIDPRRTRAKMLALKPPSQSLVREPPTVCPRGRVCACTGQLVRHPFPPRGCSAWCNVFCGSSDCNVFLYYEIAHTNTDTTCGAIKPSAFLALHIIVGHAPSGTGLYGTRLCARARAR